MRIRVVSDNEAAQQREGIMVVMRKQDLPRHLWNAPNTKPSRCSKCGSECLERVNNPPLLTRVCAVCAAPDLLASNDVRITETAARYVAAHNAEPKGNA